MENRVRLGISSCLLGDNVRFDGGNRMDRFLTHSLAQFVDYVPVCPEIEAGFGVPREPFRLEGDPISPRLITVKTRVDYTERMVRWAKRRVKELEKENLHGFIFKSSSPSDGMMGVKVYTGKGRFVKKGVGIFARMFMQQFPLIPAEEDRRLHDPKIRENFVNRIFTLQRWRKTVSSGKVKRHLVDFHTRNKLLLLAHSPKHYRLMCRLMTDAKQMPVKDLFMKYENLLIQTLALRTTIRKNLNVLRYLLGYFKKRLSRDEEQELFEVFEQYRNKAVPLVVPTTLINHFARKYNLHHLLHQTYLHPHPVELTLKAHV
ncbi:MAG: DUF523 and DUF1722 domain-containing protein [Deltaproteobacteria bacterium]|nr:DUF523 and DUF1722 domain-containing protein [Deltaproteobacteria bacterium]MBW2151834.1 DUF523 and DUF1722 domain-containing protein [Deltaproteobacteria bacterium]